VRYLRLDLIDVKDPVETLPYYRKQGLLRGPRSARQFGTGAWSWTVSWTG